ncbi:MAG: hypothetical protein HC784_05840 [Hydrococcus sp. CSU_1_8]|nr:hypothetical protein [Hydrococcus sp. CSU_1_8]
MPDTENIADKITENVTQIIETVKENPGTYIEKLHNQGIFITGGNVNMTAIATLTQMFTTNKLKASALVT